MSLSSLLCKLFGIGCAPVTPPAPHTAPVRLLSVDVDGTIDFTASLELDVPYQHSKFIVGERLIASAPWHITFTVPAAVTCGASIKIISQDSAYESQFVRVSVNGVSVDQLGGLPKTDTQLDSIVLVSAHVDPSQFSLEDLANIRGAMWTETLDVPLGPRPGAANNVAATDFLWNYDEETRARIVANLRSKGYTHAVIGPVVDSDGYHGCWEPNDWRVKWDQFLDMAQYLWDNGLAPIVFLKPDNWSYEQTVEELTPLLQQERAQKLIRIIVPAGWEPTRYDWSSETWRLFLKWGRETLPNALCLLHTVSDVDAPVGTDERGDDNGKDNALGWHKVAPYLHGWLTQTNTYERKDGITDGRTNFENWTRLFNPSVRGSYQDRFRNGYASWPTYSAWGSNRPLKVYAGEYLAYWTFWKQIPKEESRAWGDAAMRAGADGYLDGGTVPVGDAPVPWRVV